MDNVSQSQTSVYQHGVFNEEFFLKCICNYPVIYDSTRKGHSNRLLTDKAWDNISLSMTISVETCKKKWKSLREKYTREKQKLDNRSKSGAGTFYMTPWPHMSFFQFMFDSKQPRETSSSDLGESQLSMAPSEYKNNNLDMQSQTYDSDSENFSGSAESEPFRRQILTENDPVRLGPSGQYKILHETPKAKRKKNDDKIRMSAEEPMVGILKEISSSLSTVSHANVDKLNSFSSYLLAELRDMPQTVQEEFIDETVIRLLQVKRKNRTT